MKLSLGVMQGRLLPSYLGRYQAHPVGMWHEEFYIARDMGFDHIEFIVDQNDLADNPLMTFEGLSKIERTVEKSGTQLHSACLDIYMDLRFLDKRMGSICKEILSLVIRNGKSVGIGTFILPFVDESSMAKISEQSHVVATLQELAEIAEREGVILALETDLDAKKFQDLLKNIGSQRIRVNYDIGNSASLGYSFADEFEAYYEDIVDIHIKDRVIGGGSVMLGTGNADLRGVASYLVDHSFKGLVVLQAFKGANYLRDIEVQKEYISRLWQEQVLAQVSR